MAGIYIHIPFCKQACYYCNFHFSTSLALKDALIEALVKEIELRNIKTETEVIETIYFGGGTPSLLSMSDIDQILSALAGHYKISTSAEVSLEAGKYSLTKNCLSSVYLGFNFSVIILLYSPEMRFFSASVMLSGMDPIGL